MIKDLDRFLNKDGTINARKVRGSLGSRRNRKEGSKCCRRPGSRKPLKMFSRVAVKLRRMEVEKSLLERLLTPAPEVAADAAQ